MNVHTDDEDRLRTQLHGESSHIGAGQDLFERVRTGAVRRRRTQRAVLGIATAAIVIGGTAIAFALPGSDAPAQALRNGTVRLSCPASPPDPARLPTGHPGATTALVPGTPDTGIACIFALESPTASGPARATLTETKPLDGATLAAVTEALAHPVSNYTFRCPMARQYSEMLLEFGYADGSGISVEISTQCPYITNGAVSGAFNPHGTLPAAITDLLSPKS